MKKEGALGPLYGAAYDKVMGAIGGALAADKARDRRARAVHDAEGHAASSSRSATRWRARPRPTLAWDASAVAAR